MVRRAARGRANARMALVGNPSDGAGGAVLALTITDFEAVAEVEAGAGSAAGPRELIAAAIEAFPGPASAGLRVSCETSIPRQVGLGGSSAIVIATMRALAEHHGTRLEPDALAAAALSAERDVLGIPCGPQDRYSQAYGGLVLMDFAEGARVQRVEAGSLPRLFLAYLKAGAESSAATHAPLSERGGDPEVAAAMAELAELAREAGRSLASGNGGALGKLMDASFDLRARMMPLDEAHVAMIETARSYGASANYTGSGGAIVGTVPEGDAWDALSLILEVQGCTVLRPTRAD